MTDKLKLIIAVVILLLLLIFGNLIVQSVIFGSLLGALVWVIYDRKKSEDVGRQEMLDRIDDRIWDIPVEIVCRHCSNDELIDFTLETQGFKCSRCKGYNKIFIQFTAIGETERSKTEVDNG